MGATTHGIVSSGASGTVIDIECHVSNNLPAIVIVGYATKAVDEAKERLRGAFAESNLVLPRKRITINLAPADLPKTDSGLDLAIAAAVLKSSGQLGDLPEKVAFIAEIGLDGQTRPVRGIIGKLLAGRATGITTFFIAAENAAQAQLVPRVTLYPVDTLIDLYLHSTAMQTIKPIRTGRGKVAKTDNAGPDSVSLGDITGQERAKRALQIAAAGGHNVFLGGPPGTGKSLLAKALRSLLPAMEHEEMLEVTQLHSLASRDFEHIVSERPFRAPHHGASHTAIIGGGTHLLPGEISLAHHGVLLFDELPEFGRATIEALRQPLEDGVISIARANDRAEYPANFIFIATANPCPCGFYGSDRPCRCTPYQIKRYQRRMSGPILDRIDLFCDVSNVEHSSLLKTATNQVQSNQIRTSIERCRGRQKARFKRVGHLNANMTNTELRARAQLTAEAKALLNQAAAHLNISARSYMRCVKVARTIADLADSTEILPAHISEALAYRQSLLQPS